MAAAGTSPSTQSGELGAGDVFSGTVPADVVAQAAWEALRRAEAENCRFSVGSGGRGDWDDEFVKLVCKLCNVCDACGACNVCNVCNV